MAIEAIPSITADGGCATLCHPSYAVPPPCGITNCMTPDLLRILDANANRAREALRVLEDFARFSANDAPLTESLKHIRHDLAATLAQLPMDRALLVRDTEGDVGTAIKTAAEFSRPALRDVLTANAKRLTEALRSLEETAKILNPIAAQSLEQLRYRAYTAEKSLTHLADMRDAAARFRHVRLYVLLTESLCDHSNWQSTLDVILSSLSTEHSELSTQVSPLAIQLREKNLPDAELLARAKLLVQKCHDHHTLAIINDRPDIAHLSQADGVHLGQTDVPCIAAREILGPSAIIGISTESLDQAHAAANAGATYLAAGPMFPTTTKEKPRIASPQYAQQVLTAYPEYLIVAIGGITPQNAPTLTQLGIQCLAVSGGILRVTPEQIPATIQSYLKTVCSSSSS